MAFIELDNVTFTYPDAETAALNDLSLKIEKGQFVVLFGSSGSGKSTLLRLLKKEIQPHGEMDGDIKINGFSTKPEREMTKEIGFVFQDPENQVVAENVLQEIVFGLENMGLTTNEMRSRVAEMVHFFGVEPLLNRKVHELSGGKKQQINLASVLLMQPDILLLDEPTAQLDPVSARELLDILVRLNGEFGMTIILAEHRLEEFFTLADKIVMMEKGRITHDGDPRDVLEALWYSKDKDYVPSIPSLFFQTENKDHRIQKIPLNVKEGRTWLQNRGNMQLGNTEKMVAGKPRPELFKVKDLSFFYSKEMDFVLKDLDFSLHQGEIYALLGGNGSGKSTLLKLLCGIFKPIKGKISFQDKRLKLWKHEDLVKKIGYLPQNPKLFFIHDTVEKEIRSTMEQWEIKSEEEVNQLLEHLGISHLRSSHPYDLSGGELQKAALACLILRKPEVLLLDEPTKGLDPAAKEKLAALLQTLNSSGVSVLMSTHDIEFAAQYATKCGMMFQGQITSEGEPKSFFKGNFFYTTMIQRLFRQFTEKPIVTLEEAVQSCLIREH